MELASVIRSFAPYALVYLSEPAKSTKDILLIVFYLVYSLKVLISMVKII